ncbi:MAG: magnesium transporter [Bacteroidales bacterium]|nr:magnesium transporter [Bacteroidales bacterium]MBN2758114.1 magnesium transporter [Bacteroidales bacterium]
MRFELTKEYIAEFKNLISNQDEKTVTDLMSKLHAADIAEIYYDLNIDEAKFIFLLLDGDKAADVLAELEEDDRIKFLNSLPSDIIAKQFIDHMDSDDAADILGDMSEERKDEVLSFINDVEQAGDIVDLLNYHEDTAGGLMAKELIMVNEKWDVETCVKEIRKLAQEVDEVYYVYVVDDDDILKGTLSLKRLIVSQSSTLVSDISNKEIISVKADLPAEDAAIIAGKYDLVSLPVVDSIGRLIGRITIDDVIEVIQEKAEKDYQMVSGITEDVEPTDRVWVLTRARLPWLLIGLVGGVFDTQVIGNFESALAQYASMIFFIPLIAAMGGNVGVQSSSIIVQALASNTIGYDSLFKRLLKELSVAFINAIILSALIFIFSFLFYDSIVLSISVSVSLVIVVVFASVFGTFVPLALDKFNIDPALATGPFITTVNDITGLLIYLSIAHFIFSNFS